ncbi:MAG: protein translocase subunit SecD [Coriobacteriales bacterium]|nr:protein translocase subunit SecD [Coriobacteriales bacterium]
MPDRRFKPKKRPSRSRNHVVLLILLAVLLVGSAFMFWPLDQKIRQGLDVQGGLSVVLQASKIDGTAPTTEEMEAAKQIVEQRVNLLGASEASVQIQGTNQLLVQIPGIVDQTQALGTIGTTGVLEFVNVADITDESIRTAIETGNYVTLGGVMYQIVTTTTDTDTSTDTDTPAPADETTQDDAATPTDETGADEGEAATEGDEAPVSDEPAEEEPAAPATPTATDTPSDDDAATTDDTAADDAATTDDDATTEEDLGTSYSPMRLLPGTYTPIFTGANITNVNVGQASATSSYFSVNLQLDGTAASAFGKVTTELYPTNSKIAIVLDGMVQSAPAVQSAITDGSVAITGDYDLDSANSLKTVLQSGSLPISLEVANSQVVGPTLGQDSLRSGILVAIIGLILVAIYLLIFYRGIGLLTAGAIGVFAVLYLGILAVLSAINAFALSLAGIAGIVLSIGVAADSSILVLERFKEEVRMGRSVRAASITGVRHAIITSIDADLVTLVSALALFFIAVGSVKGFGLTLALGVVCDILTMLIFKAPLLRLLAPRVITKHPGFWGVREDEAVAHASGELKRGVENG